MKTPFSRRTFVKTVTATGAALLAKLSGLVPEAQWSGQTSRRNETTGVASAAPLEAGELYAGFVLLKEGETVPAFVKSRVHGVPIVCGVGHGRGGPKPTVATYAMNTTTDLAREGRFPMYTFGKLPSGLRSGDQFLIKHDFGAVIGGVIGFESHNAKTKKWENGATIWAQTDFPKPYPLWSRDPVEPSGTAVVLEKTNFLNVPGVMVATFRGFVFHWIQNDVFYTLTITNDPTRESARALINSLTLIR